MSARFILISSYPKSGNTWTRLVFDHVRHRQRTSFSINEMNHALHGSARRCMFDAWSPVSSSDLTFEEIENLLPETFRAIARNGSGDFVVKVHDSSHRNKAGAWIFPPELVHVAIYLVRHPFDVAVSYANHSSRDVGGIIDSMSRRETHENILREPMLPLPQQMGSWTENVESWIFRSPYRTFVARYEDLHAAPESEFSRLISAAGIKASADDIKSAVSATRFERLQGEEREKGFREKPAKASSFFRSGRPRSWEGLLDDEARRRIVQDHGPMMKRLGYLDDGSAAPMPDELRKLGELK